jgi:hypothetical protein
LDTRINLELTDLEQPFRLGEVSEPETPTTFQRNFALRVKASRIRAGISAAEMARQLKFDKKDTYLRCESRNQLDPRLFDRFCELTGADIRWLMNGKVIGMTVEQMHRIIEQEKRTPKHKRLPKAGPNTND